MQSASQSGNFLSPETPKEGKAFRYFPRLKSKSAGNGALGRILDKMYRGSRELLVAGLLENEDVSADELRSLQRLIEARLEEVDK